MFRKPSSLQNPVKIDLYLETDVSPYNLGMLLPFTEELSQHSVTLKVNLVIKIKMLPWLEDVIFDKLQLSIAYNECGILVSY